MAASHDGGRAAVVDLEGVVLRTREVVAEVDQVLGGRAGVAVDHLVVVAHPETVVAGGAHSNRISSMWAALRSWNSSTSRCRQRPWAALRASGSRQEDLDRPVDLLVEVDRPGLDQRRPVGVESARPGPGHRG